MPTVKGVFATLLTGRLINTYVAVLTVAVSAVLVLFMAWRWRQEDRNPTSDSLGVMFAAALAVSLLVAPHMYAYDLTLLLLAIVLVIGSPQWSQKSVQRMALTSIIAFLYIPFVYILLLRWNAMYTLAPVVATFALAVISLPQTIVDRGHRA
jgi:hypothetical protein